MKKVAIIVVGALLLAPVFVFAQTAAPIQSSFNIISPNGGEMWNKGTTQTISWTTFIPVCQVGVPCHPPAPKYYDIQLVAYHLPCTGGVCPQNPDVSPYTIANNVSGSSYSWSVGKILDTIITAPNGLYTIQVCQTGTNICDSSDSYFNVISVAVVNIFPIINLFPAIPVDIKVGQSVSFSWGATDADNDYLSWSISWGDNSPWETQPCPVSNPQNRQNWNFTRSHAWAKSGTYSVGVTVRDCRGGIDKKESSVRVNTPIQPTITVLSPNAGDTWVDGQTYTIRWNVIGSLALRTVHLRGYINGVAVDKYLGGTNTDSQIIYTVNSQISPPGSYSLVVCGAYCSGISSALVPITIVASPQTTPSITVISPNGGEKYKAGDTINIRWSSSNYTDTVATGIFDANGNWTGAYGCGVLTPNTGNCSWTIPSSFNLGSYRVKVSASNAKLYPTVADYSDAPFSIVAVKLNITPKSLSNGKVGTKYSKTLKAHGGKEPYKFGISTADPNIPPGLSLLTDGTISGIPTKVGTYDFTVGATSADGISGDQKYKIVIAPNPNAVTARLIGGNITSSTTESIIMRIMLKNNTDTTVTPNTLKLNFTSAYPTKFRDLRITGENGVGKSIAASEVTFPPVYTFTSVLGDSYSLPSQASREIQVRAKVISYDTRPGNIKINAEYLTINGDGDQQAKGFPITNTVPKNVLIMIRDNVDGTAAAIIHSFDWVFGN